MAKKLKAWDEAFERETYTPEEIEASDKRVAEIQRQIEAQHPDREKVIEGLECCLGKGQKRGMCEDCPYNTGRMKCNLGDMHVYALALLKAQEARVMTLEEYDAWTDIPFTERDPVFHEERTERGSITCWVNTTVCSLREYGKNDRCWTSRPTKEQMEAVKWE